MLRVTPKPSINKMELLFGGGNLMLGTFWLLQNKNRLEKKLVIRQGFKHLLFRAEAIDKKVVKQDIVEVRVRFINSYEMDYNIGPIKISINEQDIPPGIKLLKTSRDVQPVPFSDDVAIRQERGGGDPDNDMPPQRLLPVQGHHPQHQGQAQPQGIKDPQVHQRYHLCCRERAGRKAGRRHGEDH
jgi:hypothetical protein